MLIVEIINLLDDIYENWKDPDTVRKAKALSDQLSRSEFLFSMVCLSEVLETTIVLSNFLQKNVLI